MVLIGFKKRFLYKRFTLSSNNDNHPDEGLFAIPSFNCLSNAAFNGGMNYDTFYSNN